MRVANCRSYADAVGDVTSASGRPVGLTGDDDGRMGLLVWLDGGSKPAEVEISAMLGDLILGPHGFDNLDGLHELGYTVLPGNSRRFKVHRKVA